MTLNHDKKNASFSPTNTCFHIKVNYNDAIEQMKKEGFECH